MVLEEALVDDLAEDAAGFGEGEEKGEGFPFYPARESGAGLSFFGWGHEELVVLAEWEIAQDGPVEVALWWEVGKVFLEVRGLVDIPLSWNIVFAGRHVRLLRAYDG